MCQFLQTRAYSWFPHKNYFDVALPCTAFFLFFFLISVSYKFVIFSQKAEGEAHKSWTGLFTDLWSSCFGRTTSLWWTLLLQQINVHYHLAWLFDNRYFAWLFMRMVIRMKFDHCWCLLVNNFSCVLLWAVFNFTRWCSRLFPFNGIDSTVHSIMLHLYVAWFICFSLWIYSLSDYCLWGIYRKVSWRFNSDSNLIRFIFISSFRLRRLLVGWWYEIVVCSCCRRGGSCRRKRYILRS